MGEVVEPLILDLLDWLAKGERGYDEVMDVWRTSCPRLPVWEEANERGFVAQEEVHGRIVVTITLAGAEFLNRRGLNGKRSKQPGAFDHGRIRA